MSLKMARPNGFEPLTPRFVVWGKTIGLIEDRSHNNWCLKLLHDLRHESVATLGSISYFDDARGKLVLGARPNFDRRRHKIPVAASGASQLVASGSGGHPVSSFGRRKPASTALRGPGLKNPTRYG